MFDISLTSTFTAALPQPAPAPEPSGRPVVPDRIEDLGIQQSIVTDLILRYLWLHGSGSLASLHTTLKLSFPILETLFHQLRTQQVLEVKGMVGNDYAFTLTAGGRAMAASRNEVCQYVGSAPVSLDQYHAVVKAQAAKIRLNRDTLRLAFDDLVLPDGLLDQLGPSLIGHQSLFLYGGTGNGKTSIAERVLRIYKDTVLVPYAVEVSGHIVTIFDPVVHRVVPDKDPMLDPRWVLCERPCITVGGEFSASMLELRLDEGPHVFIAPCQLKANNGILIVDDFGRQMITPRELADEAFLRRIQTKVLVEDVTPEVFDEIFQRVSQAQNCFAEPGAAQYLRERCLEQAGRNLRACYPIDIFRLVKAISEYEGRPVRFTKGNIDRAVALYFAKSPSV
jgi:hypothetical protein